MDNNASIAVFCGSSEGTDTRYAKQAKVLGKCFADQHITLVYGGGARGLMGDVAEACFTNKGKVIGVLPEIFNHSKVLTKDIMTELRVVKDMHERKKTIYELADAFLIMPGGIGTMDEFFEIYTWKQIGYHNKNIGLLNVNGFFNPLLIFLEKCVENGFLSETVYRSLIVEEDESRLLERLLRQPEELPLKY